MAASNSFDLQLAHSHAALAQLPEPKQLFKHLLMCLETPRPSNEPGVNNLERITKKLMDFGAVNKLDCAIDAAGNVRLRKAATFGYEAATKIVIQSHMDVVCSKSNDKVHDFTSDPVVPIIEGNLLRADRTTLGADDGIGVAAAMAILEEVSEEFVHGPLEAVFTTDEETTMGGAENIAKAPFLQSSVLINVDSEESGSICIGCAGGFEKKLFLPLLDGRKAVDAKGADAGKVAFTMHLHSLLGGHTGIDIHKGRANALILIARLLSVAQASLNGIQLISLSGGNAPNAIPRDATFKVLIPLNEVEAFKSSIVSTFERIQKEFEHIERKLTPGQDEVVAESSDATYIRTMVLDTISETVVSDNEAQEFVASIADSRKIIQLLLCIPHGPIKINVALDYAVDTSISFSLLSLPAIPSSAPSDAVPTPAAGVAAATDVLTVHVFCRSSFDLDMRDMNVRLESLASLCGATYTPTLNEFPGWDPRLDSPALKQVISTYRQLNNNAEPKVYSVHAGLECGLFKLAYPELDCVSIGPTIHHAHSPQECLLIDTVKPFYAWLKQSIIAITKDSIKKQ